MNSITQVLILASCVAMYSERLNPPVCWQEKLFLEHIQYIKSSPFFNFWGEWSEIYLTHETKHT